MDNKIQNFMYVILLSFCLLITFANECLVLCNDRKMVGKQSRYIHGRLSQHALVHIKRAKPLRVVGETSWVVEVSSSRGLISPDHDKSPAAPVHASDVVVHAHDPHLADGIAASAPDDFFLRSR